MVSRLLIINFFSFFFLFLFSRSSFSSDLNNFSNSQILKSECQRYLGVILEGSSLNTPMIKILKIKKKKISEKNFKILTEATDPFLLKFKNDKKASRLLSDYIDFVETLFPKQKAEFYKKTSKLLNDQYLLLAHFSGFRNYLNEINKFEILNLNKLIVKYSKENQILTQKKIYKLALKENKIQVIKFQKLYNGCHAKQITPEHLAGGKAYTAFTISIAAISSGVFYSAVNAKDDDFLSQKFFRKLAYEMSSDAVWAVVASTIFKSPQGSLPTKAIKMYFADNGLIMGDAMLWEKFFSENKQEATLKLKEIQSSSTFKNDIEKLKGVLERKKFIDKVKIKFELFLRKFRSLEKQKNDNKTIHWGELNPNDLENKEVKEQLIQAILMEMYDTHSAKVSLGSYGADRYAYYSALGIPFMFLDAYVAIKIYQTLCMAPMNPLAATLKAGFIFTVYSVFYDIINYPMRKHIIGQ